MTAMAKAMKISPENFIDDWGHVQDWEENGVSGAPTGWVMTGTAGSVARESSTIKFGTYSMKIISGASGAYSAEYRYDMINKRVKRGGISYLPLNFFPGRTVRYGKWVWCASANKARIYIDDGVTTTYSSYHTGSSSWEFLEVGVQISSAALKMTMGDYVAATSVTAYFSNGVLVEGEQIFTALQASQYYLREVDVDPSQDTRSSEYSTPRSDGSTIDEVRYESRKINLRIQYHGTSYSDARTQYETTLKALWGGVKELYIADDRLFKALCIGIPKFRYMADFYAHVTEFRMIAPVGTEQYISKTRKKQTISASPTSFSLSYLGNVPSLPIITIIPSGATVSNCVLENLTTGERLVFTDTVPVGSTLEIDCFEKTVRKNGVDGLSYFPGDFLQLTLGTNNLKFTGDNSIIRIDWFDRWL